MLCFCVNTIYLTCHKLHSLPNLHVVCTSNSKHKIVTLEETRTSDGIVITDWIKMVCAVSALFSVVSTAV